MGVGLLGIAIVLAIAVLLVPMLAATPAPLTSDESLYLSEAYNIAQGEGPTYASGDIIHHRPPLFPALAAAPIKLTGGDPDAAYVLPKLVALALVIVAFAVGWQAFGPLAGALAAVLVASSSFLRWLGTTMFLDGTETLFLLLMLAALLLAFQKTSIRWFAIAGFLFGAAFLTKEAAIQWLPLPIAVALLSQEHRNANVARGLAVYLGISCGVLAFWWLWVYAETGRVYFWGEPNARLLAAGVGVTVLGGAVLLTWTMLRRFAPGRLPAAATGAGVLLLAVWCGAIIFVLEVGSGWPFPREHWRTVPDYLWTVAAPNTQPWPLLAAGLGWLSWRAFHDTASRTLAIGFLLFVPFALLVANRSLSLRDLLPIVIVGYVAAGGLAAVLLRSALERAPLLAGATAIAGLALFGAVQTNDLLEERLPYDGAVVSHENWDNPLVHDVAAWLNENAKPGTRVMSSRLYYSQIYVLDGAAHPVHQLPTVRVEPRHGAVPFLEPMTTLFRWEDHRLFRPRADPRWLFVERFPTKGYLVALSEYDLIRELQAREIDYVILTGADAAFSSFSYLDYFEANPAFDLVHADVRDASNAAYIFEVERGQLALRPYQAAVDEDAFDAIARASGLSADSLARAIDPDGVRLYR